MKKRTGKQILAAVVLVGGIATPSFAQTAIGRKSAQFLTMTPVAKAEALGTALVATGEDVGAVHINPAVPSFQEYPTAVLTQQFLIGETQSQYAAYGQPLSWGVVHTSYYAVKYPQMDRYNNRGVKTGTFSAADNMVSLGYATKNGMSYYGLLSRLNLGVTVKMVRQNVAGYGGSALAVDGGFVYHFQTEGFKLGASILNSGQALRVDHASAPLPQTMRVGFGYKEKKWHGMVSGLQAEGGVSMLRGESPHINLGGAISLMGMADFMIGFDGSEGLQNRFRLGLGFGTQGVRFQYGYSPAGDMGATHKISMEFRFAPEMLNFEK